MDSNKTFVSALLTVLFSISGAVTGIFLCRNNPLKDRHDENNFPLFLLNPNTKLLFLDCSKWKWGRWEICHDSAIH
jgi:hypothetical protein